MISRDLLYPRAEGKLLETSDEFLDQTIRKIPRVEFQVSMNVYNRVFSFVSSYLAGTPRGIFKNLTYIEDDE